MLSSFPNQRELLLDRGTAARVFSGKRNFVEFGAFIGLSPIGSEYTDFVTRFVTRFL